MNEAEQELAEQLAELKLRMKEVGELVLRCASPVPLLGAPPARRAIHSTNPWGEQEATGPQN